MKKRVGKRLAVMVSFGLIMAASLLQGCKGEVKAVESKAEVIESESESEEVQVEESKSKLKDFTTKDGSVSIRFDENWIEEDLGSSYLLGIQNEDETEAIIITQFPKNRYFSGLGTVELVKERIDEAYDITDNKKVNTLDVLILENEETYECVINTEDGTLDAYIVYGETESAFYSLMYAVDEEDGINKEKLETVKECFTNLKEKGLE